LPEIEGYGLFHINSADEMVCFSAYNLVRLHEDTFVMVVESLNSWLRCLPMCNEVVSDKIPLC
jgi:hypothetical protein